MSAQSATFGALRSPAFALLWMAGIVSGFGDKITLIALSYVSWVVTGSTLATALAVVIATVPNAAFGFFGGAIADAFGRRRAMIACDLVRVVVIGAVPLALAANAPLAVPFALVLLSAICGAVFRPARVALVPDLVAPGELTGGNSLVTSTDRTVEIVGALAAGVIVAAIGSNAFFVDAATFGASAALLSRLRYPERPSELSISRVLMDTATGLRVLRHTTVLWANTIFSLVAQLAIPVFNSLSPVLVFRTFGGGAAEFATLEAAIAAGAVGAGVALPKAFPGVRKGRLLVMGFAANGVVLMLTAVAPSYEALLVYGVLVGVTNILFFVPNVTIAQERTPPEFRARVFGARLALLNLTWLPMVVITGALGDAVGVPLLIGLAGLLTLGTAVIGAFIPAVRDVS